MWHPNILMSFIFKQFEIRVANDVMEKAKLRQKIQPSASGEATWHVILKFLKLGNLEEISH